MQLTLDKEDWKSIIVSLTDVIERLESELSDPVVADDKSFCAYLTEDRDHYVDLRKRVYNCGVENINATNA